MFDDWKNDAEDLFDDDLSIDGAEIIDEKDLGKEFEKIMDELPDDEFGGEIPEDAESLAEEIPEGAEVVDETAGSFDEGDVFTEAAGEETAETAAASAAASARPRAGRGKKLAVGIGIAAVAAVACVAGVIASGRNKFASGTTINEISVSRMTADEARDALSASFADYELNVRVGDDYAYTATAEDLSMALREDIDFQGMIDAQTFGSERELTVEDPYTYNLGAFHNDLAAYVNTVDLSEAKNAYLVFDEEADEFVVADAIPGYLLDPEAITEEVGEHVGELDPEVTYTMDDFYVTEPELGTDSPEVLEALDHANAYKDLEITVSFTPDGRETTYETIDWEHIRDWVSVDYDGLSIFIDDTALSEYVSEIANAHSVSYGTSQFRTTGGSYISVRVASGGQSVNTSGLYQRVYENLQEQTGGTVTAPFDTATEAAEFVDFGGNYVELNLNAQVMYCYNGGVLVCSAPCVSGNVSMGWATPNGVYHIYSKQTNRYLTGPGYRSFVNYWMPFNGGIGLHDGTWRDAFGGSEYLYNGSHGCVNLPLSAAATVFANVHEGTAVIVYGGATYAALAESGLTAPQTSFTLHCGQSAGIGATAETGVHYVSDNEAVATVSEDGTITAVAPGSATINVTADQDQTHLGGTMDISVTVTHGWSDWTYVSGTTHRHTCSCDASETAACDHTSGGTCSGCGHNYGTTPTPPPETEPSTEAPTQHQHHWGSWTVTQAATCGADGVQTRTCSSCGDSETQTIPATGAHSYGDWVESPATCTEPGTRTHTCSVCGASEIETTSDPTGHVEGEGVETVSPTATEPGVRTYYCVNCGEVVRTEEIPPVGE
ncbi:MAG: L,D-transpeptidase family protein [Lachnospiraceae bacterium]|nr:L,D-transpeptidase family protein [Lachnospiraceae bacterium]